MVLYELFCISAHNPASPTNLRQLIEGVSKQIHAQGGVIRDLKNMGIGATLPTRVRRHHSWHHRGDHFLMTFDTSPAMISKIGEQLRRDPLVIRWTFLKKGAKLSEMLPKPAPSIDFAGPSLDKGKLF
ncbi:hypothetical protein BD324DRAFT_621418 [Kockovaella imperatae]|uniref:Ribosomal protein S6 n=1 Tax=Kockovaella imperatae TaxID=4999 RepID=A0A1Y1UM16_9TREE|nr:hypothetical protein BD324DRAFT_621418 [Kockovaella imperatae]ORX38567.1 hypothetical protein BD324DRAFT_621418 [Kockovaella imperatae]